MAYLILSVGVAVLGADGRPEPAIAIDGEPVGIFQRIKSGSEKDSREVARALKWHADRFPQDAVAKMLEVNLDADAEPEVIFRIEGGGNTLVLVFDHHGDGWWMVGKFAYWWHWSEEHSRKFLELREVVEAGRKDLILRERGGGTGFAETVYCLYRMRDGRLYRVFEMVEERSAYFWGSDKSVEERRRIEYRKNPDDSPVLVVRTMEVSKPDAPSRSNPVEAKASCSAFGWDERRFSFWEMNRGLERFCSKGGQ